MKSLLIGQYFCHSKSLTSIFLLALALLAERPFSACMLDTLK